jgi:hypothetical protein
MWRVLVSARVLSWANATSSCVTVTPAWLENIAWSERAVYRSNVMVADEARKGRGLRATPRHERMPIMGPCSRRSRRKAAAIMYVKETRNDGYY